MKIFWGLVVCLALLFIFVIMSYSKEGITSGGAQYLEQGYFAGGRQEAFQRGIPAKMEGLAEPDPKALASQARGMFMDASESGALISGALAAHSQQELQTSLGCGSNYQQVAPNEAWGWMRSTVDDKYAAKYQDALSKRKVDSFKGGREGLDNKLSSIMNGN